MLDAKGFNKGLKSLSTTITGLRTNLQALALYAMHHIMEAGEHGASRTTPMETLLKALTEEKGGVFHYKTNDAQRLFQFIVDYCPVSINPQKQSVKFSAKRAAVTVWMSEDEYPNWWEHTVTKAVDAKEQDGFAVIVGVLSGLYKRIEAGKVKITPESKPSFDAMVASIDKAITAEREALRIQKEQELAVSSPAFQAAPL